MHADPAKAKSIFLRAVDIASAEQRASYLTRECGGDEELRQEVEEFLAHHGQMGSFLEAPEPAPPATLDEPGTERPSMVIGPYKLLQQIGGGGMGTVFMAEQTQPVQRKVALKLIKAGLDSRQVLARFAAERQALALMDHPNIAKVLDAGTTESGRPYFVMELVKGVPITRYCDEHHLTPRERLELFVPVCQAVQHAHHKGIIHRDLKPSNVMVCIYDGKPVPKVIDFGVAKATGPKLTDRTLYTEFGAIVGTFEYMSPEQAELDQLDVDTRSDIYSLGVLLYELLTGSTPLERKRMKEVALLEMLRLIREEEAPRPSTRLSTAEGLPSIAASRGTEPKKLSGLLRGELDWMVLKALEKDRNRRYETANAFAADVVHYLHDESVLACPPSAGYRFRKFARRNRAGLTTAAVVAAALVIGTLTATWQALRATKAEGLAQERLETANTNYVEAEKQRQTAKTQEGLADEQRKIAVANEKTAREQEMLARRRFYAAQTNLAMQAWEAGQPARVLELLESQRPRFDQEDLRAFEWYYLWGLCKSGHRLALGAQGPVASLAFSPDGKTLAYPSYDSVRLLDWATGKVLRVLRGHQKQIWNVTFSPDGNTLASGGVRTDGLKLWEVSTGKLLYTKAGSYGGLAFSPDGKTLATWAARGTEFLDAATGQERAVLADGGEVVGFLPDGKTLVTLARRYETSGEIQLWNVQSRARRLTIPVPGLTNVALSPDGAQLATCGGGPVALWDTSTGKRKTALPAKTTGERAVAFSPDGKLLAVGGDDRTVVVWDVATGRPLGQDVHVNHVWAVAFSPGGKTLASATLGGDVTLWDMTPPEEAITNRNPNPIESLRFMPDSKTLMVGGNPTQLLDVASGKATAALPLTRVVQASADGNTLVRDNEDTLTIWDVRAGRQIANIPLPQETAAGRGLSLSPDGKMVAIFHQWVKDATVTLWDIATQQPRTLTTRASVVLSVHCAAFSPDAKLLAAGFQFQWIAIWDVATGKLRLEICQPQPPAMMNVHSVAFSPDGKALAVGTDTGAVTLWEVETGMLMASFRGHTKAVFCLAFSPDGKTLATAGADTTVRLWDVATGQERITLKGHTATVGWMTFAPDGNTLATASGDGTLKLWRGATHAAALTRKRSLDPHDPDDPIQLNSRADLLWKAHRLEDAENVYRRARSTLEKLAVASANVARYRAALTRSQFSLSLLEFHVGRSQEAKHTHDQAKDLFEKLPADGQQWVVADICELGSALLFADQAQAAERAFVVAIELKPDSPYLVSTPYNRLAWILATCADAKFRNPGRAVELAKKAVALTPNEGMHWNTLGVAHYRAGDCKAAVEALTKSDELLKGHSADYNAYFLAMSHWQLGNREEARTCYDQAVKNKPEGEELRRFRAEAEALLKIEQR